MDSGRGWFENKGSVLKTTGGNYPPGVSLGNKGVDRQQEKVTWGQGEFGCTGE